MRACLQMTRLKDLITRDHLNVIVVGILIRKTIELLFCEGDMKLIWTFFSTSCEIPYQPQSTRDMLIKWWLAKPKNSIHELLQCTPSIICWEIWKSRCTRRFEHTTLSIMRIINRVIWLTSLILNSQFISLRVNNKWMYIYDRVERLSKNYTSS